ncbi:MAG: hypothetical protein JSR46_11675 [Verrucomicrobia bacterium]|nr:hypothetical protein [Verrucomicrobiota bacterium]
MQPTCKGLGINVWYKIEIPNQPKEVNCDEQGKVHYKAINKSYFTRADLESCFAKAIEGLSSPFNAGCTCVFFTVKGSYTPENGNTAVFGNAGKTPTSLRERHKVSIEDVQNGKGLEAVHQSFLARSKAEATQGFYR